MRLVDYSFRRPEENLAYDEVLLNDAESGVASESLRFWESPVPFVVLGVAQILRREVWHQQCQEDGIPILRRCSAGGCVLQGPGCLNFNRVLSHELHPDIKTLRGSYCYILDRICEALHARGVRAHHKGVSDLAVAGQKISGNSQKRRRRYILHHGTLLYALDLDAMERFLREPLDRPQYRGTRDHRGFLRAVPLPASEIKAAVCEAFGVAGPPQKPTRKELDAVRTLAAEKYADHGWTWRR